MEENCMKRIFPENSYFCYFGIPEDGFLGFSGALKKNPPTLYLQTRESPIPLFFLVRTRPHEQISHFWICPCYEAIWDWFFVVNLSTKLFPTTKKNFWSSTAPQPTQHKTRSEIPKISSRMLVSQRYGAHLSQGDSIWQKFFFSAWIYISPTVRTTL